MSYLPQFPVDVIKIDQAFVHDVCDGPNGSALARTIVELARRLSLQTIAEGVENEQQAEVLSSIGCTAAQGWWFARAEPACRVARPGTILKVPVRR